jgi:hypothetical protein
MSRKEPFNIPWYKEAPGLHETYTILDKFVTDHLTEWQYALEAQGIKCHLQQVVLTADGQFEAPYLLTPDNRAIIFRTQPGSSIRTKGIYGTVNTEVEQAAQRIKSHTENYLRFIQSNPNITSQVVFICPSGANEEYRTHLKETTGALVSAATSESFRQTLSELGIEVPPLQERPEDKPTGWEVLERFLLAISR